MMRRFFFIFIFLFLSFFSFHPKVFAASQDITVNCSGTDEIDDCVLTPANGKLFEETNVLPGDTFIQLLDIHNLTSQPVSAAWQVSSNSTTSEIADVILITVFADNENEAVVMTEQPLSSLLADTQFMTLATLQAQESQRFAVRARMDADAGNQYQGQKISFTLAVAVQLSSAPSPTPTPTATPNSINATSTIQGSSTTAVAAPVCQDASPDNAPIVASPSVVDANGQVTINWTAVSPVTTYAMNFGITSGEYLYGNADMGNVTSYTVGGLTPGAQYYFQVLGVNGCAPGPRSNEVITPGQPTTVVPVAPAGFTEGEVLGISEEPSPFPSITPTPANFPSNPTVLGTAEEDVCSPRVLILAGVLLLLQLIGVLANRVMFRRWLPSRRLILSTIITVVSLYLFYLVKNCQCTGITLISIVCSWYWFIAIFISILASLIPLSHFEQPELSSAADQLPE